ncbi:MAG TPA: DISARM system SNF2-like helicase DrmD [Polyangia bacterium]|nr:DISARM system SNF2-like helicase DrmD [Polyangia bacterium]
MTTTAPTPTSTLGVLPQRRILDLARVFGVRLRSTSASAPKAQLALALGGALSGQLPAILRELGREELAAACKAHGLPAQAPARRALIEAMLVAAGIDPDLSFIPPPVTHDGVPRPGQIVRARHRQWLVEAVQDGLDDGRPDDSPRVTLVCLDDDDSGRRLEILWDLELGAQAIDPEKRGLGPADRLDPPAHFGAYLHALRWNAVSAADATRFQAPFRAGIEHMAHQLTPLMKALELPRANLFIADDVGLGKTIEAGLVMQELILRQQAHFVLIACPASICLQWQSEMRRRFGLHFEVMTRAFIAQRRRQRGFGVNPWATHHRFVVSHALLRRPEYREPLLQRLGDRAQKSLLVLDEAHVAAPATRSRYAVDSEITATIRDLAPRFDNRLFLSATPHNGHSNSFSALLEILDPVRFTRGVPVEGKTDLAPVMVRRLKRDLKKLGIDRVPDRVLVQIDLAHESGRWSSAATRSDGQAPVTADLGAGAPVDLELASMLARYTELCAPEKGRARLPFIRLQQRLLSSPEAFARSLEVHAQAVERRGGPIARDPQLAFPSAGAEPDADPDLFGPSDEALQAEADAALAADSARLPTPTEEAAALLSSMRATAEKARRAPDAKLRALIAWLRANLCPAIGHDAVAGASRLWKDRRVILFTEWADTKRYILDLLREAVAHTDQGEDRVAEFGGGLGDEAREEIQRRFNAAPEDEPLRILVATDAAREGLNLQAHCADLFHVDLPWNPARLEQRNGRIDRTLQPEPEVRCHYFVYPARPEDRVLATLVRKIDVVQRELGSLGGVLLDDMEALLAGGIRAGTAEKLEAVTEGKRAAVQTADAELEEARKDDKLLREEITRAGRRYNASRSALEVSPEALRQVVDVGLRLAGTTGLVEDGAHDGNPRFRLPALDRSWDVTLDTLRPPRPRDESFYDWRQRPPLPVTFSPVGRLTGDVEQLHLAHPFTKRILDRFLAQGFSAHDLRRVTAVIDPEGGEVFAIGYARLTLFGPGAARLHDELVAVASTWDGSLDGARALTPRMDVAALIKATEARLAAGAPAPTGRAAAGIAAAAETLLANLWRPLEDEADARAVAARNGLGARARAEADGMRALLERQRRAIEKTRGGLSQRNLFEGLGDSAEAREQQRQLALDLAHMDRRERDIATDLEREPAAIEALYAVRKTLVTPVGVVVSWPRSWT